MIEAVENHIPQVIVIDEIGIELEAIAAGTIAQCGVQLVGTAHGMTVENLIKNPSLQMLVGGIQVWFFFCIPWSLGRCAHFVTASPRLCVKSFQVWSLWPPAPISVAGVGQS